MTRAHKVSAAILTVIAVLLLSMGFVLSRNAPCGAAPPLSGQGAVMKAVVYRCYGSADVLKLENVRQPAVADDEVLVRVHAASVNPLDFHYMRGTPYVMRLESGLGAPEDPKMGFDFAGTVETVGKDVKKFRPGDEVFGGEDGAFAEYVAVRESQAVALKPANITFEQAAAVPIAAITALQALRDQGRIQPGQKVLINGASGGVGTFAVQIAKSFGVEVTGVCSTKNVELVRSLGADHVVDYTREDFTRGGQRYDLIFDLVGNRSPLENRRALKPNGTYIGIGGGGPESGFLGTMSGAIEVLALSKLVSQKLTFFLADLNQKDLTVLADLMRAGKVTPVIDRRYKLSEVPAAVTYLEAGHARGKVVIAID